MAIDDDDVGFLELYDVEQKRPVARRLLREVRFIPRAGERIFIRPEHSKEWDSYTVANIEYFIGVSRDDENRITIFVERNR